MIMLKQDSWKRKDFAMGLLKNFQYFGVGFGFWFLVLAVAGAGWGNSSAVNQGEKNMSGSPNMVTVAGGLPPLDMAFPARVETFTFGLG